MARCAIDYVFAVLPSYDDPTNALAGLGYISFYPRNVPIKLRNHLIWGAVPLEFDDNQVVVFVSTK